MAETGMAAVFTEKKGDFDLREFPVPDGIVSAEICPVTGHLRGVDCPSSRLEVFLPGTEPEVSCRHPLTGLADDADASDDEPLGLEF